jgi:hypothetical protein
MTTAEQDAQAIAEGNYMKHSQRWIGPNIDRRTHPPLSNDVLAALREAAARNGGRPLTDKQRAEVLSKFQ